MLEPPIPADEAARLQALHALNILDTPAEERFDRYTRLAQHILQTPIVLISLIDGERQWFKSRQGLDATETPRDISFCGHAILGNELFCIPDAAADPRFADNPLVTGAPDIRFYAGEPLTLAGGEHVGTLCAIDRVPRTLSDAQRAALHDLAQCVADELQVETTQTALQDKERLLQQSSERVRSIIDTVVDGIITIDAGGLIQTVNPATERLFGYAAAAMIGQNVKLLMPEPFHSAHDGYLHNYTSTGVKKIIGIGREVVGRRQDGTTFPMDLAVGEMTVNGARMFTGIVRDITERKAAQHELDQFKSTLDQAMDCVFMFRPGTLKFFYANRGAIEQAGYSIDELRQMTPLDLKPHFDENKFRAKLAPLLAGEKALVTFETEHRHKDGHLIPVEVSLQYVAPANEPPRFVNFVRDISERKKMERMKSEFVSTVSHELRTPLTSIRGALGLVLGKFGAGMADKARQLLETANRNSERLTLLINDILDLEKIESGRLDFEFKSSDLVAIARQAISANEGYGHQHGVRLRLVAAPEQARLWADEHRLLQVFANLISNAVKYSPRDGEVEVGIHATDGHWRVSVRDHGRGIPAEFRSRMFQRFAQADSSDTREKGGTGLGLSITKAIVERHSGSIDYTTTEGQGTEFFFILPQWQATPEPAAATDTRPCMLICEDNADVAMVLGELLNQEGIASDVATTGAAAKAMLGRKPYRGLLLDLGLPDMDGLVLLRELRADAATRELPVVVVSGRTAPGNQWAGESLAVIDWLQKPVDRERLSSVLSHVLSHGQPPRILHVEDDPDIIQVTQTLIEELAEYHYATSLAAARAKLRDAHFDLLLLDLTLPDGSGTELLEDLPSDTRVVIFSGLETGQAFNEQVVAALTKGKTSNEKLVATLRQIINQKRD
ncbi:MAG: PAS domain S-box protein [Gammaproteobacteria bacterium]|nr:PAS domain S-box protein [Gammaproteobacteria bacterium]MBU3988940.1 PAS domain S-box protein [Gammaproteobacteria bacterium]MBU4003513.1 PAS domain S-box protein [Gammaproteobacteria bacterium]MBU4020128.1 PAS domain S-box protein [Gammaproteobacteria bacterium]MBU4095252.1 PAS domain S-box protein [Gammaproteobacteria bacterium]